MNSLQLSTQQSLRICLYIRPAYYNSLLAGILLTLLEKTSISHKASTRQKIQLLHCR